MEGTSDDLTGYTVKPGVKFWSYLANANKNVEKPYICIPQTFVNVAANTQYWLYTDPASGQIVCDTEANYQKFESFLECKKNLDKKKNVTPTEKE